MWYNRERRHLTIDYLSPAQYEEEDSGTQLNYVSTEPRETPTYHPHGRCRRNAQ